MASLKEKRIKLLSKKIFIGVHKLDKESKYKWV